MPLDAFAELQSYQQPNVGMALAGQQPQQPMGQPQGAPPTGPADLQSRTQGWMNTFNELLSNPVATGMLLQAGLSLGGGATGGEAVGDAFGLLGRSEGIMQKQQQQDLTNQMAQERMGFERERLGLDREELEMRRQLNQARLGQMARGGGGGGGGRGGGGAASSDMETYYEKALQYYTEVQKLPPEEAAARASDATTAKFMGKGAVARPGQAQGVKGYGLGDMSLQELNEASLVETDPDMRAAYKAEKMRRLGIGGGAAPGPAAGMPAAPVPSSTEYGRNPPPTRAPGVFQPNPLATPSRAQQGRPVAQPALDNFFSPAPGPAQPTPSRSTQGQPSGVMSFKTLDEANAAAIAGKIPSGARVFVSGREVAWQD